jgi:multidrug resistance efflux pump
MNRSYEMKRLDPIPSSPGHRLRQVRERILPFAGFVVVLVVVAALWRYYVAAPAIVGEVESDRVDVISTVPGMLSELGVDRFSRVTKGQVVGRVSALDPQQMKASLAAVEMDLKVLKARMDLDRTRNVQSLAGLRNDLEVERLSLAAGEIQLVQANSEYERTKKLVDEKVVALGSGMGRNDFGMEVAARDRDRLLAEVASYKKTVRDLEIAVQRLESSGAAQICEEDPLIEQAIAAQKARLLLFEGPVDLYAPIDGVISAISQREGARVMAGSPILTIIPARSERIVGYVRQPLHVIPKEGDRVHIRTRSSTRQSAYGQVLSVGSGLQQVSSPMRVRGYDNSQERGLPFLVSLPPELKVFPGELVDLSIEWREEATTQ